MKGITQYNLIHLGHKNNLETAEFHRDSGGKCL